MLHVEGVRLKRILRTDTLALLLVLLLVLFGVLHHSIDLVLGEAALVVGDRDLVLLSRRLVLGRNVENAVGVDVECDFDLRNAARRWRNARQLEFAEQIVVFGHRALALIDLQEKIVC